MDNIKAFKDSSLRDIQFNNLGKDLVVRFDSSYDGEYIGNIVCKDVIFFEYKDTDRELFDPNLYDPVVGFFASYVMNIDITKINDYYEIKFEPMPDNIIIHCLSYEVEMAENQHLSK